MAKGGINAQGPFNAEFWTKCVDIEKEIPNQYKEERKVSLGTLSGPSCK
jgi:hypothetical protein